MITGSIANGSIQIVLGGIQAVTQQLARVKDSFNATAASAAKIGATATTAFNSASSSITSFARAASPLDSLQLDIALARVSVQLGRFFLPLLRDAATALNRLADYLGSLDDSTRESVLKWTKFGLAIGGVLTVGAKLAGVFGSVAGVLGEVGSVAASVGSVLWRILGFLGPWGRAAVIIGTVVAAFVGLNKAGQDTEGVMGRIVTAGKAAWEGLKNLWGKLVDVIGPALAKAGNVIEGVWDKIVSTIAAVWDKLTTRLGPPLERLAGEVGKLLSTVGLVIAAYVERYGRDFEKLGTLVGTVFDRLAPLFEKVFGGDLVSAVEKGIDAVTRAIQAVQPYAEKLSAWLVAALESDQTKGATAAFEQFTEAIKGSITVAEALAERIGTGFVAVAKRIEPITAAVTEVFDKATSKTSSFVSVLQELGTAGQTIGAKIGEGFNRIVPYLERIGATASKIFEDIKAAALPVVAALVGAFDTVEPPVSRLFDKLAELGGALIRLGSAVREFFGRQLASAIEAVRPVIENVIGGISSKVEALFRFIAEGFEAVYPTVKAVIDAIGKGFVTVVNYVKNAFFDMVEAVLGLVSGVVEKINKLIDGINRVKPGDNIPNIENPKDGLKRPDNIKEPAALPDLPKQPPKPVAPAQPPVAPPAPGQPTPQSPAQPAVPAREQAPAPHEKGKDRDQGDNRFVGQLLGQARFIGIADAFKAAQQATVPTRETAILEEIARGQRDTNANLGKIVENTGRGKTIELK